MKNQKLAIGLGAAAVVVVGGVLVTAYSMGGKIEGNFKAQIDRANAQGLVQGTVVSYDRGLFTSTAQTQWSMEKSGIPGHITVDHQITHGPLPAGSAAKIVTQVRMDSASADTNKELLAALNGRPIMEVVSSFGWSNDSSHKLTSPEFSLTHGTDAITWGGMKADWSMSADMRNIKGSTENPSFILKSESDGKFMTLGRTTTVFDTRKLADNKFWSGTAKMDIDSIAMESKGDEETKPSSFKLQKLVLDSDTVVKGETTDMPFKLTAKSVQTDSFSGEDMVFDMVMRSIDTVWLNQAVEWSEQFSAEMTRKAQAIAKKSEAGAGADADADADTDEEAEDGAEALSTAMAEVQQKMISSLPQLLARKPELEIKRASIRTPEGVSEISALLAYAENAAAQGNPLMNVKFDLKADLSKPMLSKLMSNKARSEYVALMDSVEQKYDPAELSKAVTEATNERLQALTANGLFKEKADQLSTQISLADGEIKINNEKMELGEAAAVLQGMSN